MNPNASAWKPSAAAPAWTPGGGSFTAQPSESVVSNESSSSAIDENDPLWQAVLKIAEGDRVRAMKMINNPDDLDKYPEIRAIIDSAGGGGEEWEKEEAEVAKGVERMRVEEPIAAAAVPTKMEVDEKTEEVEGDPREHVNLVFIGHVDAGKSTLSGNMLYLTENVDKRTIEKYEREAKDRNRESWFLAFIMDTSEEERAKGITVEVGRAHFETETKRYTILDAPGHKNYVPNMIMGASQADIGVLVISARKGEFETGFEKGGQTREHAMLAKTLGVSYLIVVINKMDDPTVHWDKKRFDECVSKLRPFLRSCGFTIKKEVKFLPISGLNGANVKHKVDPAVCPWWDKCVKTAENNTDIPTLFELLDHLTLKHRDQDAPLRIPVLDRYVDRGVIAMGKVESGTIRPNQKVILMPTRNEYKVDAIFSNEQSLKAAKPGENLLIKLSGGCGVEDVQKGFVICSPPPCRAVNKLIAQLIIVDLPEDARIFTAGFTAIFHLACAEEECTISKLFETTSQKGQVNKSPRFANIGMRVVCMVDFVRTVPVEVFDDFPFLGRFTLRTEGKTVALGKVIKLPPKKE